MKTFSLFIFSLLISIGYLSGADWNVQIADINRIRLVLSVILLMMAWQNIIHFLFPNWKREVSGEHSGYVVPI